MAVTVLGYYNNANYGDDLFEQVFRYIVTRRLQQTVHICDPASTDVLPSDTVLVVCGGGDILNDYFLTRIMVILENSRFFTTNRVPLYAVGIGLQYPSMVTDSNKLDIFDRFYVRSRSDAALLASKYGASSVAFIDDLVFHQPMIEQTLHVYRYPKQIHKIGIALANSIMHNNAASYGALAAKLASLVDVIQHRGDIYLIPFNTSPKGHPESDYNIIDDLYARLSDTSNVVKCADARAFTDMDLVLCSRFHGHVLAIRHGIPLISLTHTRKARLLMQEYNLDEYTVPFQTTPTGVPTDIDTCKVLRLVRTLDLTRCNAKLATAMAVVRDNAGIVNSLLFDMKHPCVRTSRPFYTSERVARLKLLGVVQRVADLLNVSAGELFSGATRLADILRRRPPSDTDLVVKLISYAITGVVNSQYNWGLRAKITDPTFNIRDELLWVIQDHQPTSLPAAPITQHADYRVFDTHIRVDHSMNGRHRSGWSFVTKILQQYTSPRQHQMLLDSFADATFNVNDDILEHVGMLPFAKNWVGFVHHTPNESFSPNNVVQLINNNTFQQSLPRCKALVALSKYLQKWLQERVPPTVPVFYVCHPTETPALTFDRMRFRQNRLKKIVQIGGWMRNSYGIYRLHVPEGLQKCALRGVGMDSYFRPDWFDPAEFAPCLRYAYLHDGCIVTPSEPSELDNRSADGHCGCDGHSACMNYNKYIQGLVAYIRTFPYDQVFTPEGALTDFMITDLQNNHDSVRILEHLSDSDYDVLLSENIVFLDLVDASAVNTLIECVVRNTPILVNRLPAVEEILGPRYPMFYSSYREAKTIMCDAESLAVAATEYLEHVDKTRFSSERFQWEIESIVNAIC